MITFHRIKDFQLVTMKLLAQDVLQECPNFRGKHVDRADLLAGPDVQLMLPGEVTPARGSAPPLPPPLPLTTTPTPTPTPNPYPYRSP